MAFRSSTCRSTPVNGFVRNPAIRSMVTLLPPMRPLSGALAEIWPIAPQGIGGSCNPDFDDGSVGLDVGSAPVVCSVEEPAHASSSALGFSCGPIFPALTSTRLKAGLVRLSLCVFKLKRSASSDRIISRISFFVGVPVARAAISKCSSYTQAGTSRSSPCESLNANLRYATRG